MGIRYYAYAFEAEMTAHALADPRSIVSADPLADAWGLPPGSRDGVATFTPAIPERDMLYLDKASSLLQQCTAPIGEEAPRPAHRMFEGEVSSTDWGWKAWVRALTPDEMVEIAHDLTNFDDDDAAARMRSFARPERDAASETDYGMEYLRRARDFAVALAADGRGMVYLIG